MTEQERIEYFESVNQPYHMQKNAVNRLLTDFVADYIALGGDKTIYMNDGHHSRLMAKDFLLSYNQDLAQAIISNVELVKKMMGGVSEYDETGQSLDYMAQVRDQTIKVLYDANELMDEINGVTFSRTHTRRASGGKKFSQLNGILNYLTQRQPDTKLIEVEHFHEYEAGMAYGLGGSFMSILHPAFQDTTDYAKGHTFSRGSFADSIIGYTQMHIVEGLYVVKPVLSDKLKNKELVSK